MSISSSRIDIDALVEKIQEFCVSIILCGSQVTKVATDKSDIDLIVIAKSRDDSKNIEKIVKDLLNPRGRLYLDCKVYTMESFNKMKSGIDNFYIWCCFQESFVLYGEDIRNRVFLNPSSIKDKIWSAIENLTDISFKIKNNANYTEGCYALYSALVT